ncbi:DUF975 family protein [Leuconostoc inhae]|uniref:DUF975 family protein n=1 Tax=Leuconostoc inhae TaxID=178001 RepID=UPI001C7D18C4|nr:DUF975 family protein [Leuconostoc inhae]
MITNRQIKKTAWSRVTTHFKAAFLISLVPMIFTVFGVMSDHNSRDMTFSQDVNPTAQTITKAANDMGHFLQDNWFTVIVVGLVSFVVIMSFAALVTAISDFFTESTVSGFIDWHESDRTPESPIKAGLNLLTSTAFKIAFLRAIYTLLWTLLFIIPGIIKSFSYSQAVYLYRDDLRTGRDIQSAKYYISQSQQLMTDYKGQLFMMYLSLIGWYFLNFATFGLANLFTLPYTLAIRAEFYIARRGKQPEKTTIL